ncbi:hypothetical protein [Streptomyces sp. NPDC001068]|uniref:hypothetical protein n=1 Tax=Streptomyces sp. NPDC001068 TaxID=3364544 RepID=UPI0036ABED65
MLLDDGSDSGGLPLAPVALIVGVSPKALARENRELLPEYLGSFCGFYRGM